ncbi:hypothetical protein [Nocardia sp. alder85J]|uniref:hypothetical protein n=1 Tax=Nocardia sp. alder85J TaxID=2862949 RepID=UPI001CD3936B|nr:hypothetical protein [Nocardia sp. alder85J]MCX4091042.1 hypothetical protein [Nocardia sp. alder85J]
MQDEARVVELARRLRAADTGGWRESALHGVIESLGRPSGDGDGGPLLSGAADSPGGAPRLRPVGRFEQDFVRDGEEYVGLSVPAVLAEDGAVGEARAFRTVAEALIGEFGTASVMGVYGNPGPFYDIAPRWGSPFLRWRGPDDTLELHAGEHGPELLLQPTYPVEEWFLRQGHGEPYAIGGFFGARVDDVANEGLSLPGGWRTGDWDVFSRTLADFLRPLPAETYALGIELNPAFHALVPGTAGPLLFELVCGERLEIVYDTGGLGEYITDPRTFGWTPQSERRTVLTHWLESPYHSGDFGIGEVDGHALATMIVATLRDLGVESPRSLSLADHSQRVGRHHVEYYGLTLRENP